MGVAAVYLADMAESHNAIYSINLLGETTVGKTYLLLTYMNEIGPGNSLPPTIGTELRTINIALSNERRIKLQIWDTAGITRFRSMIPLVYYKNRHGFLLTFDITKERSLYYALNQWLKDLTENHRSDPRNVIPNPVIYLVGTKCDLEEEREVSQERARIVADELGLRYFEVSSYLRYNVDLVFHTIAEDMDEVASTN